MSLETPALGHLCIRDTNEFLAMENMFEALTDQALRFEEIKLDPSSMQTDKFAQMDAIQSGRQVASAFPGIDFFLTDVQVHLLFAQSFLE